MESQQVFRAKVNAAYKAMRAIGIQKEVVKPVLKRLLDVFDDKWEHIEADNFLVLADAVLEAQESKPERRRKNEEMGLVDQEHRDKKLKNAPLSPKSEILRKQKAGLMMCHSDSKGKTVEAPLPSAGLRISEPKVETDNGKEDMEDGGYCNALLLRDEESPTSEEPLAILYPPTIDSSNDGFQGLRGDEGSSKREGSTSDKNKSGSLVAEHTNQQKKTADSSRSRAGLTLTNLEVASSSAGEVKLLFSCSSSLANRSDFHVPKVEAIYKEMEARSPRLYKILGRGFSFRNLLKDICQCVVDLGFGPVRSSQLKNCMKLDGVSSHRLRCEGTANSSSSSQIIQERQLPVDATGPSHDVHDITKGEESIRIPIVSGNQKYPSLFRYIPHNATFQDAYINLSLARIGDEDCCTDCFGDCLAKDLPCACARETGGEFAYTRGGLVNERFLDTCVSMLQQPENHHQFYCKVCPLERAKNEARPDPCKGHLIKKFIKECWSKCGCSKQCGNRVVQRGITCNLQVFLTPNGKDWGLRTVEKLPRGAFVCEYVGEILTNTELYDRMIRSTGRAKHTYPVLLDADWGTEGVLKDEEALCLDATFYGNVARFINHRCFDANLIGIPVEVETPDHHYYHLAFFTMRQVEPFEELTWDYCIDFDDVNHPIKAFKCLCESQFCRDKKSVSRSKSKALILK